MGLYKASVNNFFFNSINNILVIVYGILLVPLYFKFMSLSTYGAWLASGNVVAMLGLIESGLASVITQKMAFSIAQNDETNFLKQAGANIISATLFGLVILLIGFSLSPFIAIWTNVDVQDTIDITNAFRVSTIATSLGVVCSLLGAFPQVWQETKAVGVMSTITSIAGIVVTVGCLFLGCGVLSLAYGVLTRAIIHITYVIWIDIKIWRRKSLPMPVFSKETVVELVQSCVYPFFSKLTNLLMNNSHNFIIAAFISPSATAVYDLTYKICYSAAGFVNVINGSFFAMFSLSYGSRDTKHFNDVFNKVSFFFLFLLFSIAVYSFCFTEVFISYWVGLDKFGGYILLMLLVIYTIANQLRFYANSTMYAGGYIDMAAKLDIYSMLTYIGILMAFISILEIYSVPFAGLISSVIFSLCYFVRIKKDMLVNLKTFSTNLFLFSFILVALGVIHMFVKQIADTLFLQCFYLILFTGAYLASLYAIFRKQIAALWGMLKLKMKI